jgi:hypothetical protein
LSIVHLGRHHNRVSEQNDRKLAHVPQRKLLAQLIDTLDDVKKKNRQGRASINMSFSYRIGSRSPIFQTAFRE